MRELLFPLWHVTDIPGTDFRIATIAGSPDACMRAKTMVEDIVAEVSPLNFS